MLFRLPNVPTFIRDPDFYHFSKNHSVEFLVIVFHCPQTTALSHTFLSYIIPFYRVASYVVVRCRWLGLDYWAAISYWLGSLHSLGLEAGGVYSARTQDALLAEDRKQVPSHEG